MLLVGGSHDARGRGGRRAVRTAHRRRFGRIARRGRPAVCAFSTGAGLSDSTRLRRHPVTGSSCFARVRLAATGTSARHLVQMYQSRPKWADIHLTNEVQGAQRASAEHARAPAGLGWEARTPQRGSAGKPGRSDCRTARGVGVACELARVRWQAKPVDLPYHRRHDSDCLGGDDDGVGPAGDDPRPAPFRPLRRQRAAAGDAGMDGAGRGSWRVCPAPTNGRSHSHDDRVAIVAQVCEPPPDGQGHWTRPLLHTPSLRSSPTPYPLGLCRPTPDRFWPAAASG